MAERGVGGDGEEGRQSKLASEQECHPNILWICTDQQRWDTLGCYGNRFVRTPHLDRLARDGMLFEYCYCQATMCSPSRASFLTGRYPRTTRLRQNGQAVPADEVPVTKLLAAVGYTCGLVGKLHLAPCEPAVAPVREARIGDGYAEFHWSHGPNPGWTTNEYHRWLTTASVAYRTPPFPGCAHVRTGMPREHHHTTWCATQGIEFIRHAAHFQGPWLLSLNLFDPHYPFDPPASFLERYAADLAALPLPVYTEGELTGKPKYQALDHFGAGSSRVRYAAARMTAQDHRWVKAAYWAMVDLIDSEVGRILQALDETGQAGRTIVIFCSDHGEMLGDHGMYLKGPHFYEPAIRVPLIMSCPGLIRRGRFTGLVELVDLAPTLLAAAGLDPWPGMQGHSLWPLLTAGREGEGGRADVYCEHYNASDHPRVYATMVRTKRYKAVRYHGMPMGELYDLHTDPTETVNLWDDHGSREIRATMLERLCDRMAWTVDPLPIRQARF